VPSYALHGDPLWRDRANFIISAPIEDLSGARTEQLWTRYDEATGLYEMCCIPFFIYDLALGDLVALRPGNIFDRVVTPSNHFTFRLYLGQSDPAAQQEVMEDLSKAPVQLERYSRNYVAVDAEGEPDAQRLANYLAEAQSTGRLLYETART
jgi:hypothetical protein